MVLSTMTDTRIQSESEIITAPETLTKNGGNKAKSFLSRIKWFNSAALIFLHTSFVVALFTYPYLKCMDLVLFSALYGTAGAIGVSAGAHRLWTHRAYKAKLPLRIFLMLWHTAAGMGTVYDWVRDHRLHHKYTDTDADPYNAKRGIFFSHVGWLFIKKHRSVIEKGRKIDMSDLDADPVIRFHVKYYFPLAITLGFVLPSIIPPLLWGQSWFWSFVSICIIRYAIIANLIWSINSVAHTFGTRPYSTLVTATENKFDWISVICLGESWHNFHHAFPWAYKFAHEKGFWYYDLPSYFIELFEKIGWAYDLKTPSLALIKRAAERGGDGSHPLYGGHMEVPESDEVELLKEKNSKNTNYKDIKKG